MEIYVAKALLNTPGDSENVKITSRIFSPNQFPGVGYIVLENYKKMSHMIRKLSQVR